MSNAIEFETVIGFETIAASADAAGLFSALPDFSRGESGAHDEAESLAADYDFDPLVRPSRSGRPVLTKHWEIASDGRLVSNWRATSLAS